MNPEIKALSRQNAEWQRANREPRKVRQIQPMCFGYAFPMRKHVAQYSPALPPVFQGITLINNGKLLRAGKQIVGFQSAEIAKAFNQERLGGDWKVYQISRFGSSYGSNQYCNTEVIHAPTP